MKQGIFLDGSVTGLGYMSGRYCGKLDENGRYFYEDGQTVSFMIGGLMLGSCWAKTHMDPVDLVAEAGRGPAGVTHCCVTNMARLLLSVGTVTPEAERIVDARRDQIDFCLTPDAFADSTAVREICEALGTGLISVNRTHNIVRRCTKGILKEQNVRIPMRDGRFVLADVYRPLEEGNYPVVMCMGAFGKEFLNGVSLNEADEAKFEEAEDLFYESYGMQETKEKLQGIFLSRFAQMGREMPVPDYHPEQTAAPGGPPAGMVPVSTAFEQPQADDWVPYGYAVILAEEYGVGRNPGELKQFGVQNAKDYCDAIEWAAGRSWSNGKVGLFGASYYAMTQYLAAQFHPKGLAAMIPIMGDYDSYRHYVRSGGGLFNRADNADLAPESQNDTMMLDAMAEPFWSEEHYGPEAEYMSSAEIEKIDYPIWTVVEPDASLHGLGTSEAYIHCSSEQKKLMLVNGAAIHFWMYEKQYLDGFRRFFDRWLKDEENGIMEEAPVRIQIRTGNGSYVWREASDWPVPETEYRRLYLGEGSLSEEKPETEGSRTYRADICRTENSSRRGVRFVTQPFAEDTDLAGYLKAGLYVSSSTEDMEVHLRVRVLDERGEEVIYPAWSSSEKTLPLGFGALQVSHRKQDEAQTTDYHPVYTHRKEDQLLLKPGEPVYCETGTFPTSGRVKKGWRLALDLTPADNRWVNTEGEAYRKNAENTVYYGGRYASYLQIPVWPEQ